MRPLAKIFVGIILLSLTLKSQGQTLVKPLEIETWQFRKKGDSTWMRATVPGTVHTDLLAHELIPNPFEGTNENNIQWIENEDWEYTADFFLSENELKNQHCDIELKGIDTYAKIFINGQLVIKADNMFRTWHSEIKGLLKKGKNSIYIHFESAVKHARADSLKQPYVLPGNERIFTRKAQYQYGWDWGPRLVTCGIGEGVYLKFWNTAKINAITYTQEFINDTLVELFFNWHLSSSKPISTCNLEVSIQGEAQSLKINSASIKQSDSIYTTTFQIKNPKKWWCNGLGSPNLYSFIFRLTQGSTLLDKKTLPLGIRTIELVQTPDPIGKSFYFKLNGIPVFAKGANYIPPDNFLPRTTLKTYQSIVQNAVDANMNMLRVWGGGVYADEHFYNECDRKGIMVWQDFMFACALYPSNPDFNETVKIEIIDQIKRLQIHPCIALWCGNNEINEGWQNWGWQKEFHYSAKDSSDIYNQYTQLFEHTLPALVMQYDPMRKRNYWPSSPSIGWGRKESLNSGDLHYWGVWWGMEPFEIYSKKIGRFVSEYGFQSMPNLSTFKRFSHDSDLHLKSLTVLSHQKHPKGFSTIDAYMQRDFKVPKKFENYIYVSQLLQARGMKIAIEAHRRAKPLCMGTLYWQLNDCWPVTSWSTVDYYNQWKAAHYQVKRSYKQTILSFFENKSSLELFICDDGLKEKNDTILLELIAFDGSILWQKKFHVKIKPNQSRKVYTINATQWANFKPETTLLKAKLISDTTQAVHYFLPPKHLKLSDPKITLTPLNVNSFKLSTNVLAKDVELSIKSYTGQFSDNYFDLFPGEEKIIRLLDSHGDIDFMNQIKILSLFDNL